MMDNLNAEVIPNLTYSDEKSLNWVFDGITECSTVALSLKGLLNKKEQKLLDKALAVAIKKIKPQTVVVYSVASEETTKKSLGVLYKNKINVVIPDNLMMQRNKILAQQKSYGKI
ncbi:hypothetical protein FACS189459_7050 [Bacilli bacterium]|nr:hypothetical protein FACS189459_7050 [Bacilli bacterium]